jgi:hypothetical protein
MQSLKAKLVGFAVRAQMIAFIDHDLNFVPKLNDSDRCTGKTDVGCQHSQRNSVCRKVIRICCEQLAYTAVKLGNKGLLSSEQLETVYASISLIERLVDRKPPSGYVSGKVNLQLEDGIAALPAHVRHPFFDRLWRLEDVDGLAGAN